MVICEPCFRLTIQMAMGEKQVWENQWGYVLPRVLSPLNSCSVVSCLFGFPAKSASHLPLGWTSSSPGCLKTPRSSFTPVLDRWHGLWQALSGPCWPALLEGLFWDWLWHPSYTSENLVLLCTIYVVHNCINFLLYLLCLFWWQRVILS